MSLVWKLLRQHISAPQLLGFFMANMLGLTIVLVAVQMYNDIVPAFRGDDGVLQGTYLIVSKHISAASPLTDNSSQGFTDEEIADLSRQSFVARVGAFTPSRYRVAASIGMGSQRVGTDMFFEAVPDGFVDADLSAWRFDPSRGEIPIILPRSYLAIYNFGFAESQALPKLSEGVVSMVQMDIRLRGRGLDETLRGRVVGFSTRLNTILVPESFISWSNDRYATEPASPPTRLILELSNPTDAALPAYVSEHHLDLENDRLEASRATTMLRIVAGVVAGVGLLISALALYILMLSIYLLVEKNTLKLQNLLLLGYSATRVSLPYQLLAVGMNLAVMCLAVVLTLVVRSRYLDLLWQAFPRLQEGAVMPTIAAGLALTIGVAVVNAIAIRRKIDALNAA